MSEERLCKDCAHHRSGLFPKCEIELPFWAEPHGRPAVYDYDGDDCTAFLGKHEDATKDATIKRLREALEECDDYFDNRADAEYFTDSPSPIGNEEMNMLMMVRAALEATK